MEKTIHQGRNIKRFREMLGIKQEALAIELGDDWNQRKISLLEQKETVDRETLHLISAVFKLPVEAFENFTDDQAVNIISNTFNDQSNGYNYYPTFNVNPTEKWLEALDEIKRLHTELLQAKEEQLTLMRKIMDGK